MGFLSFLENLFNRNSTNNMTKTTSSYYAKYKLAEPKALPRAFLDGYRSPSGGYLNWAEFKVVGINPQTNRKNTRKIKATNEAEAIKIAEKELSSPTISEVIPHTKASSNDFEEARSMGIIVPDDACYTDIRCMMDRVENHLDYVSEKKIDKETKLFEVIPDICPDERLAKFAHSRGIHFSMYVREENLVDSLFYELEDYDKAAFFAFYVLKSLNHKDMENYSKLNEFADFAFSSPAILKSIRGREYHDYYNPHKGTIAYKEVLNFFNI